MKNNIEFYTVLNASVSQFCGSINASDYVQMGECFEITYFQTVKSLLQRKVPFSLAAGQLSELHKTMGTIDAEKIPLENRFAFMELRDIIEKAKASSSAELLVLNTAEAKNRLGASYEKLHAPLDKESNLQEIQQPSEKIVKENPQQRGHFRDRPQGPGR